MRSNGKSKEYQCQTTKNERLDKADKKLKPVEWQSKSKWNEKRSHQEKYFTSGHIAEKTEGEADNTNEFAQEFQKADKYLNYSGKHSTETAANSTSEHLSRTPEKPADI